MIQRTNFLRWWFCLAALAALPACLPAQPETGAEPEETPREAELLLVPHYSAGIVSPGSGFLVDLEITENRTERLPATAAFRVYYPEASVELAGVRRGDLGEGKLGEEKETKKEKRPDHYRTINVEINPENEEDGPVLARLYFRVKYQPEIPFSLFFEPLGEEIPMVKDVEGKPFLVKTDHRRVREMDRRTPERERAREKEGEEKGPVALIRPYLEGTPEPGATLELRIPVVENPTGLAPINCNLRVYYPKEKLEFLAANGAQLGGVYPGPEEENTDDPNLPSHFRDVVSSANFQNRDETPECFRVQFKVSEDYAGEPLSLFVEGDPSSSAPLLGPDSDSRIPHRFDNSRVQDFTSSGD